MSPTLLLYSEMSPTLINIEIHKYNTMNRTYYIACYRKNKQDTIGYLFLQNKGRNNRVKKAIGISIKYELFKKYFNDKEQRFKSGLENYKLYNDKIASFFEDTEAKEEKLVSNKAKKSFLKYWTELLKLETNQGSLLKYNGFKTKFEKYLKSTGKADVSFSELTPDFFRRYQHYLKTAKDPKPLNNNSVSQYIKGVGIFINKKIEDDPYTFKIHPLTGFKFDTKEEVERKVLFDNEFERLMTTELDGADFLANQQYQTGLSYIRDIYLFQLFANGMRVSDLCLLRWNNIDTDQLEVKYMMFKTDKVIPAPFTFFVCKALLNTFVYYRLPDIEFFYVGKLYVREKEKLAELKKYTLSGPTPFTTEYKGYIFERENSDYVKGFIDAYLNAREQSIQKLIQQTGTTIKGFIEKFELKNKFVFPFLNDADFEKCSKIEKQFKNEVATDAELKRLLMSGEGKYRHKLKKIAALCNIKKMPSHSARHTFAKLMALEGAPTHEIKDKMGHKDINTTGQYMKHDNFKNKEQANVYTDKLGNKIDYLDYK